MRAWGDRHVWNMSLLCHVFIYFPLGNRTVTILHVTDSSVGGVFCLYCYKTENKSGFLPLSLIWVEVCFGFRAVSVYGYRGTRLLPCCSDSVWVEASQGSTQELCSKECFQILKIVNFLSCCFFHTAQTAGAAHSKLELSQILMKRDPLPFLSLFLPSFNC